MQSPKICRSKPTQGYGKPTNKFRCKLSSIEFTSFLPQAEETLSTCTHNTWCAWLFSATNHTHNQCLCVLICCQFPSTMLFRRASTCTPTENKMMPRSEGADRNRQHNYRASSAPSKLMYSQKSTLAHINNTART